MTETELAGAALPEGIEVDDTAAYFGVIQSSDILTELQQIDRHVALARFIELTADLHLSGEEFDFVAASERMNCEGGEIYYLVVSHFGFSAMCDPLRLFIGMEDSEGNSGLPCQLPPEEIELLTNLTNAMPLLGLMAIAFLTSGQGMVVTYARTLESLLADPAANLATLLEVGQGYVNALANASEGNYPEPIEALSIGGEAEISGDATSQPNVPLPGDQFKAVSQPSTSPSPDTAEVPLPALAPSTQVQAEVDVPLPDAITSVPDLTPDIIIPLPTDGSETVSKPPQIDDDVPVDVLTRRQTEVRADNVFDDAFGRALSLEQEPAAPAESAPETAPSPESIATPASDPVVESEPAVPAEIAPETAPSSESVATPASDPVVESEPAAPAESAPQPATVAETESALPTPAAAPIRAPSVGGEQELGRSPTTGEKVLDFLAADTDGDGHLSKDEIIQMVGDAETADEFIKVADTDGDGEISLPEFITATTDSSVAAGKGAAMTSLPRPVTPLRRPVVDATETNVGRTTALAGKQYVIKSGIHCGGCGIGIDPHWRHCVVCGAGR